jgi:hypothetical protein
MAYGRLTRPSLMITAHMDLRHIRLTIRDNLPHTPIYIWVFSLAVLPQSEGNWMVDNDHAISSQQIQSGGDGGTPGRLAGKIPKRRGRKHKNRLRLLGTGQRRFESRPSALHWWILKGLLCEWRLEVTSTNIIDVTDFG